MDGFLSRFCRGGRKRERKEKKGGGKEKGRAGRVLSLFGHVDSLVSGLLRRGGGEKGEEGKEERGGKEEGKGGKGLSRCLC